MEVEGTGLFKSFSEVNSTSEHFQEDFLDNKKQRTQAATQQCQHYAMLPYSTHSLANVCCGKMS